MLFEDNLIYLVEQCEYALGDKNEKESRANYASFNKSSNVLPITIEAISGGIRDAKFMEFRRSLGNHILPPVVH